MNRVALDLGFIEIYWYSIFIILAMCFGFFMVFKEAKRKKINDDFMSDLVFKTIVCAIIGARLYYVAFEWDYYKNNLFEILEIWNGGLAIHGGILFGFLYVLYKTKTSKVSTLLITDICACGLLIGQAIGRWGNFFNSEAYGPIVEKATLQAFHLPNFIIEGMFINGAYHHPTFLYESILTLIGFVLFLIFRRFKYLKVGQLTGFYLMWYSFGRFLIEILRQDSLMLFGLKVAMIVSGVLFIIGFVLVIFRIRKGRFEYLYNNTEYVETTGSNTNKC